MVVAGPGGRVFESTSGIGWTIRATGLASAFDSVVLLYSTMRNARRTWAAGSAS